MRNFEFLVGIGGGTEARNGDVYGRKWPATGGILWPRYL